MSTTTITAELPRARPHWRPRLVTAEFLKLRKRRGLVISALLLAAAPMVIAYIVLAAQHAANPAKHGPAGGVHNFTDSLNVLAGLSGVAAILIGASVGSGDLGAGVFRELVVTGRSRLALFAARVPAGLGLLLPVVGVGFAITATASNVLAGSINAPSAGLLAHSAGWLALVVTLSFMLSLGVSSLVGSRGTSIGILLGWQLVAAPILLQIKSLGVGREGLVQAATQRFEPAAVIGSGSSVPMSLAATAAILAAWTAVPLALGAWRTCTRDA